MVNCFLVSLLLLSQIAYSEGRLEHWLGTWKVDTNEVKAHIRGVDQEGVYVIPDHIIPTSYTVKEQGNGNLLLLMKTESGVTQNMKILLASPSELIFTYDFVDTEQKVSRSADKPYLFPELFRCAFRNRILECIVFTDKVRYRCLAYRG